MAEVVIVTGAGGFVGRHVVRALREAGCDVVEHQRADGDLAEGPPVWPPAAHVVHLAGRTFVPAAWSDPAPFRRDNVDATTHVLEYCRLTGASMIHVSSYVYGTPVRLPIDERHPLDPFNPYAESKILAERAVQDYQRRFGVRATIVRPFNLFGPGQDARFLIPTIIRQARDPARAAITLTDDRPRRDYLHVRDLAALIVLALRAPLGDVYNAGSGESHSVRDIADRVGDLTGGRKPLQVTGPVRPNEILDVVADVSHAAATLGWRPRIDLMEGLQDTIASTACTESHST
jgi:nucleoside-diphosphate-sugar epimerase